MGTVSISGTTFTIYGTYTPGAVDYWKGGLGAAADAWTAASSLNRQKALVASSRWLDRAHLVDPTTGAAITSATDPLPEPVEFAAYELAGLLLVDATIATVPAAGSNVKRERLKEVVGPLESETETEYFRSTFGVYGRFPEPVQSLLGPYLSGGGSGVGVPFVSGTDVVSSFFDPADPNPDPPVDFGFVPPGLP